MARPRGRRTRSLIGGAVGVVVLLIAGLAIAWPGYDARQTPLDDGTIWALQRSAGGHYARVNTEVLELDTVKQLAQPTTLAQTGDAAWAFAAAATKVAGIDPATPPDLDADATDAFAPTPSGTRSVAISGDDVAYLIDSGDIYLGRLSRAGSSRLRTGEEGESFAADAVTVGPDGVLAAFSASSGEVMRAVVDTGEILGIDTVPDAPAEGATMTLVGRTWVLMDAAGGRLWIEGVAAPIATGLLADARLAVASTSADEVYISDSLGLIAVGLADGIVRQVTGGSAPRGIPAAPRAQGGDLFAAWLPATGGGTLWTSIAGDLPLDYASADLGTDALPEFLGNGSRLILNDTQSGWVWTVPDGRLVPSSQSWQLDEQVSAADSEDAVAPEVLEPKPPVAVGDVFGVRAGRTVLLPVLLNDHDPNEDVLSIVSSAVSTSGFGQPTVTNAEQMLVIDVPQSATGTTTFSYRITDGTAVDGLLSETATVTLNVIPEVQNSAPEWCGTDQCLAQWPEPTTAPGGTLRIPVLDAFVDPDGDPIYVSAARVDAGPGSVTVDPAGVLTYQHPDANADATTIVSLTVIVTDSRGSEASRTLTITVSPSPRLEADDVAVSAVVGRPVAVSLAGHIRGAAATPVLAAVSAGEDDTGITVNAAGLSFIYTPQGVGSTVLQYTVRDQDSEQTGTVRITAVERQDATVSAPPLVAFVRPNEDTTVDVLGAVSNPAHLVLLLSDLRPEAAPGASLSVDPVGQSTIRASGTTADGAPGELGVIRYTISDGTGDPAAAITGQLTVILLPTAAADPPIATADTATVRVGGQIDIPVLDNDSAPTGGLLAIDPSRVVNEAGAGLAFATSRTLRYLAPETAGTYTVTYTAYRLGYPELTDTARVTITVLGDDSNTAPTPETLEGRALSGKTTSIAFDPFGIDPDGDTVTLDAVVDQPLADDGAPAGTATISADGSALIYTAPPDWSGQASFTYRVRDGRGATATGLALVGVRDGQSDPRPVTFSDYVQIEGGGVDREVTVTPLENDVDPSGAELTLVDVRPNAQEGTDEYSQIEDLLVDVSVEDGTVTVRSGSTLGTYSFVYTVANTAGDTAMGLIVLKVVRNPVPDYPEVRDTILTAESIDGFADGVDVLSGKVTWTGGDADALRLALWREMPGVTVSGRAIAGAPQVEPMLIPFTVTGIGSDGAEVSSYGFLRVPGESELRPTLRTGTGAFTVGENESVEIELADIIAVPRGSQLELSPSTAAGGARADAACELIGSTTLRYSAGAGAPWTDTCSVQARLVGAPSWTVLTIRLTVEAEAPQPILAAASRTLSPGQSALYDLHQLTSWTGAPAWNSLEYAIEYSGDQFAIRLIDSTLEVTGADGAGPGRTEVVTVRLTSHPDVEPSALTLVVGPAPSTLPKAGTATQQCSQASGATSCEITVVGLAGEINPLPGTPLELATVTSPANCPDVTFSVASATAVRATWAADAPGSADCTGSFHVADAQGRLSTGERAGTVVLDLRGLPSDPATIEWTSFDTESVTLRVTGSGGSYPAVEGYRVSGGGQEVACSAEGLCPPIVAEPGAKVAYQAWAVNAVGESRAATSAVTAWPYEAPSAPRSVTARPVATSDGVGGVAAITVGGFDPTTGSVRVTSPVTGASETLPVASGATEVVFPSFAVGANRETTLTVTPLSRFDYPPIAAGTTEGTTTSVVAYGIGAPRLQLRLEPSNDGSGQVRAVATVSANGVGTDLWVGISTGAGCAVDYVGATTNGVVDEIIAGEVWENTTAHACAEYRIGSTSFGASSAGPVTAQPTEPIPAPSGTASYTIAPTPIVSGQTATWSTITGPSFEHPRYETRYGAGRTAVFADLFRIGEDPGAIEAWWCVGDVCSAESTTVSPAGAAYTTQAVFPTTCDEAGAPSATMVDADPADYAVTAVGTPTSGGAETAWEITVAFAGRLGGLDSYTHTGLVCPTP